MSVKIIQEKLEQYQPQSWTEEENALKEIFQEVALAALGRTDFFKYAVFQGDTAFRILYTLQRFSEDLDFVLKEPDPHFRLPDYFKNLSEEFEAYGILMEVQDRSKLNESVQKAFLKDNSPGGLLSLKYKPRHQQPRQIKIKLEIDTNPPAGSEFETKFLDFPIAFAVVVQDPPSLFAGKNHALLCRGYIKGRDWYDFLWYVSRKTPINFKLLGSACKQNGPWKGKRGIFTKDWYLENMENKILSIDWIAAKKDVARFLKPKELPSLDLWDTTYFLDRLKKLKEYF